MRNLLLLFLLTLGCFSGYAQQIPEKANTIIITLPDSNMVKDKVLKVLKSKDYPVQNTGKASASIMTQPKTIKNNTRVSLTAHIKGAEVTLTGRIVIATQGSMPIEYKGNKGTPIMNAWEEMDKIAKALEGKITYEVK